jgi:hypothetical protein
MFQLGNKKHKNNSKRREKIHNVINRIYTSSSFRQKKCTRCSHLVVASLSKGTTRHHKKIPSFVFSASLFVESRLLHGGCVAQRRYDDIKSFTRGFEHHKMICARRFNFIREIFLFNSSTALTRFR